MYLFKPHYYLFLISILGISLSASAEDYLINIPSYISIKPFLSGMVGSSFAKVGESQTSPEIDSSTYSYNANTSYQTEPLFGALAGIQVSSAHHQDWILQTGILYQQALPFTGKGTSLVGYSANTSTSYSYSYHLHTQQLFESTKLAYTVTSYFHPFIQIAMGAAMNQFSDFQANALEDSGQSNIMPIYNSHTNTHFAYQVGAGFDSAISQHWLLGISYQFADLGRTNSGNGEFFMNGVNVATLNYNLEQKDLQLQQIIGQLTYVF